MAQQLTTYTESQLYRKTVGALKALCRIHGIACSAFQHQRYKLEFVDALLEWSANNNNQPEAVNEGDVDDNVMNVDGLFTLPLLQRLFTKYFFLQTEFRLLLKQKKRFKIWFNYQ